MKPVIQRNKFHFVRLKPAFALVVTLSLMILLTIIAVGLLSLSAVSLRSSSQGNAQAEAQANARLALMIALGELQKEMGPDMRVSAESALFDSDKDTEAIEGVAQSHWLGSYDAWGDWLNASYTPPGKPPTSIGNTYNPGRTYYTDSGRQKGMFRRWLLSMPVGQESDVDAPNSISGWNTSNSVVLVGQGSLGSSAVGTHLETRAYLTNVVKNNVTTGKSAWWIGPENHKARIDKTTEKSRSSFAASQWETSQGDTAEVGVDALTGFDSLADNPTVGDKLITTQTLRPAAIAEDKVREHFFDLTASSRGVLASVRTGRLKKDLSLLFEKPKADLPNGNLPDDPVSYRFSSGDVREPSIRPMSNEIANRPVLGGRHFASWTRMRHFHRMYRQDSDAEALSYAGGGTDGGSGLNWEGSTPWTNCNASTSTAWGGKDSYVRFPILTNATYILSLMTEPNTNPKVAGSHNLHCVATPVLVYWNPYNVELRVPNKALAARTYQPLSQPVLGSLYSGGSTTPAAPKLLDFQDDFVTMTVDSGDYVIFRPGQFRIFTPSPGDFYGNLGRLLPGFNPLSFGGMKYALGTKSSSDNPALAVTFSPVSQTNRLFNSRYGNTPGSFLSLGFWTPAGSNSLGYRMLPFDCHVDWLNTTPEQAFAPISPPNNSAGWIFDNKPRPIGYMQLALKGTYKHNYDSAIGWAQDWRCRNWIQAPPFYLGKGLYLSEDTKTANTQRMDCPYEMRFGSLLGKDPGDILPSSFESAYLSDDDQVTAIPCLELPTAPIASLAGFSGMRIDPGWTDTKTINGNWELGIAAGKADTSGNSLFFGESKALAYQSGITGPGIGNSFLHPMIPRSDVYRKFNNSISMEPTNFIDVNTGYKNPPTDTQAYCDYWDHVLLLNDALWDDYFVSSLADQTRPGATASMSLAENLQKLAKGEELANSRYMPYLNDRTANEVKDDLDAAEGYLKAAKYLMVDGMFNVNSTSVAAWHALFAGIRERQVVYRDKNGILKPVIRSGKRIVLSRFNTADTDQETTNPEEGIDRDDGMKAWSGVRFLTDAQLRKLAEECVKQVKRRGPFLNFSEFINRRFSNDDLGIMGALQSAIDYDADTNPDPNVRKPDPGVPGDDEQPPSINYDFKRLDDFRIKDVGDLGNNSYATPEAAVGSRYAGIPGYVIQSDLLKPIANTLSVRDDTFRIRAYGESREPGVNGKVLASAWCEAIVQRMPEYCDPANDASVPARLMNNDGRFSDNSALNATNRLFGRKFRIESFRWLSRSEI